MNRIILLAMLVMTSIHGALFAQNNDTEPYWKKYIGRTKTDKTFNVCDCQVNFRDFVKLKDAKMVVEANNLNDFEVLKHLDSVLLNFKKDIAFYKDSLDDGNGGHVRIDYVLSSEYAFKKIRFKKYAPDGNIFIERDGDVSKLKLDQDTVRLIFERENSAPSSQTGFTIKGKYLVQVSFYMDNYTDIDKIIADKTILRHTIDTLEVLQTTHGTKVNPYLSSMSVVYQPYDDDNHYKVYHYLIKDETTPYMHVSQGNAMTVNVNVGVGLIRNTFAPTADLGLEFRKYMRMYDNGKSYTLGGVYASPYFFFDKNADGSYHTYDNWFVNAYIGSAYQNENIQGLRTQSLSVGLGYLVAQKGGYFKNTTMKAFFNLQLSKGVTISPELIATDNFKQIFPGLTLKVF
jgi:hypothetical protein